MFCQMHYYSVDGSRSSVVRTAAQISYWSTCKHSATIIFFLYTQSPFSIVIFFVVVEIRIFNHAEYIIQQLND